MTIFNLGSINADYTYTVPTLPAPGETVSATSMRRGLGGKGANQSIAAARDGARVVHVGAVGTDGDWAVAELAASGVDTRHIAQLDMPTGHAIINVDERGENAIVIHSSANTAQSKAAIEAALGEAAAGDILLLQNETNLVPEAAARGRALGMKVIYSAAPFDVGAVRAVLGSIDLLVANEVEAKQLHAAGDAADGLQMLVTAGARGARLGDIGVPAFVVDAVDTTGAGDTYLGVFAAGLDAGLPTRDAMRRAAAAAAIQVTRPGTAEAIPSRAEIDAFLNGRG